ncbi:hypothetical protein ACTMU2_09440 [Cupriavidus basilensis]
MKRARLLRGVGNGFAVHAHADQLEVFTDQHQRCVGGRGRMAREAQRAGHDGALRVQVQHQFDVVDGEGRRGIVLAIDGNGRIGAQHGESCLRKTVEEGRAGLRAAKRGTALT